MLLTPRQFVRLFDNRYRDANGVLVRFAKVATLPISLGAYIPTRSPDVLIEYSYARKLVIDHQLKYEDFKVIPDLIEDSFCVQEKAHHLTLMGYRKGTDEPFSLVLKAARGGDETWVATLHRERPSRFAAKLRRHKVVRHELAHEFEE